jgi:hypothetical protein
MSAALAEALPLSGYVTGSPGHASPAQNDLICALQTRIAEALLAVHSGGSARAYEILGRSHSVSLFHPDLGDEGVGACPRLFRCMGE